MYLSEAIEVENLVKIFVDQKQKREIHACDGLTFSVDRGEVSASWVPMVLERQPPCESWRVC